MATTQSTSQPSIIRTTKLASAVSTSATVLVERFGDILEIAAPNNKDKYITAAETYQIDVHAAAMVRRLFLKKTDDFKVRAADELLAVTRKLKQLWILSESKEDGGKRDGPVETPLELGDVAQQLERIIRKEGSVEEKNGVQQDGDEEDDEIQID